jgi:hypothetical protein
MEPVRLLSLSDSATLLGVDESTVRRQIKAGELVASPIGRRILVHPCDLADYQQRLRCPSPNAKTAATSSPFATTASELERLIGTGRTKMPASTNGRCRGKSATLRVVGSPNG